MLKKFPDKPMFLPALYMFMASGILIVALFIFPSNMEYAMLGSFIAAGLSVLFNIKKSRTAKEKTMVCLWFCSSFLLGASLGLAAIHYYGTNDSVHDWARGFVIQMAILFCHAVFILYSYLVRAYPRIASFILTLLCMMSILISSAKPHIGSFISMVMTGIMAIRVQRLENHKLNRFLLGIFGLFTAVFSVSLCIWFSASLKECLVVSGIMVFVIYLYCKYGLKQTDSAWIAGHLSGVFFIVSVIKTLKEEAGGGFPWIRENVIKVPLDKYSRLFSWVVSIFLICICLFSMLIVICFPLLFQNVAGMSDILSFANRKGILKTELGQFIHMDLKEKYLWNDRVPPEYTAEKKKPQDILDSLIYKDIDRWSYIVTKKENNNWNNGRYSGLGMRYKREGEKDLCVSMVFPGSPADKAGVKRGFRILSVDDYTVSEIIGKSAYDIFDGKEGESVRIVFENRLAMKEEKLLTYGEITTSPVMVNRILKVKENDGFRNVGYFYFHSFNNTSYKWLDYVFREFRIEGVTDLVVDLRYNGGGILDVARYLGCLIAGERVYGNMFAELRFNERCKKWNESVYFNKGGNRKASRKLLPEDVRTKMNSLNLNRVFVITTKGTASASEFLINGLKPFIEVIQIGDRTNGKPVGMAPVTYGGYVLSAINFQGFNAKGYGDFFKGIEPSCRAEDDLNRDLGDPEEACLKEALYFIGNGRFMTRMVTRGHSPSQSTGEEIKMKGLRQEIGAF